MSTNFNLLTIKCIAPEKVLMWSEHVLPNGYITGEIKYAETIHYRTLRPIIGGIFCQLIFGCTDEGLCNCKKKKARFPVSVDKIHSIYLASLFFHLQSCLSEITPIPPFLQRTKSWRRKFKFFEPNQRTLNDRNKNSLGLIQQSAGLHSISRTEVNSYYPFLISLLPFSPSSSLSAIETTPENRLLTQIQRHYIYRREKVVRRCDTYFNEHRTPAKSTIQGLMFCQNFVLEVTQRRALSTSTSEKMHWLSKTSTIFNGLNKKVKNVSIKLSNSQSLDQEPGKKQTPQRFNLRVTPQLVGFQIPLCQNLRRPSSRKQATFFFRSNNDIDRGKSISFIYFRDVGGTVKDKFHAPQTPSYRWYQCFMPFGKISLSTPISLKLTTRKYLSHVLPPVTAVTSSFVHYNLQASRYQRVSRRGISQHTHSIGWQQWGLLNRFERGFREFYRLTGRIQKLILFYIDSAREVASNVLLTDGKPASNLPLNQYRHLPFCPKCGVFRHSSRKRRYQIGYIDLLFQCSHIWYVKTRPSILSILLDLSPRRIHQIVYLQVCFVSRPNYCLSGGEVWNYWSLESIYQYLFGAYGYGDQSAPWNIKDIKFEFSVSDSGSLSIYRFLQRMDMQKELKRIRCFLRVSGQDARTTSAENRSYQTLHELKDAYPPSRLFPDPFLVNLKKKPIVREVARYRSWKRSRNTITLSEFRKKYPSSSGVGLRRKPFDKEENWKQFVRKNARALIAKKRYFCHPVQKQFFSRKRKEKELLKLNQTKWDIAILEDHIFSIDKDRRMNEFDTLIADWGHSLFFTHRSQFLESEALIRPESKGLSIENKGYLQHSNRLSTITSLWVFFHKKIQKKYRDNYTLKVLARKSRRMKRPKINPKFFFYTDLYQLQFKWAFIQSLSYRRLHKPLLTATNAFKNPLLWVEHEVRLFRRYKIYQRFVSQSFSPSNLLLKYLPVLPPNLRPLMQLDDGNLVSSDLNDLYLFVIRRKLRLLNFLDVYEKVPNSVIMEDYNLLQNAVDMLIENGRVAQQEQRTYPVSRVLKSLTDFIKGKQGRFRHNLLGKRVDYSGRSVIVVEPKLNLWECGLPREMALKLFYPLIVRGLIQTRRIRHRLDATRFIQFYTRETCLEGNGNAHVYLQSPLTGITSSPKLQPSIGETRLLAFLDPRQQKMPIPLVTQSSFCVSPTSIWAGLNAITHFKSFPTVGSNPKVNIGKEKKNTSLPKFVQNVSRYCYWGGKPFMILTRNSGFSSAVFGTIFPNLTDPNQKDIAPSLRAQIPLSYQGFTKQCLEAKFAPLYPSVHRFWTFVQKMIQKHIVLLNRAPTLHRLGIQAFYPRLVPGRAIQLHPLVCPMFNADFDGDQMGVHVPLSIQAQVEAQLLMLSTHNWLSPATGQPSILPSQDMVLGFYYVTAPILSPTLHGYFDQFDDIIHEYHSNQFEVHQSLWVACRTPYDIAQPNEELYEVHLDRSGTSRSISAYTCWYEESYGILCHHYLRTTPGRILFNHLCQVHAE